MIEKAESRRQKAEVTAKQSSYFCLLLFAFCLLLSCARESRFLERSVSLGDHQYRYRVWLPPHYTKVHHWPVILFLHGSNERGDDNERQLALGLAPALEHFGDRYKAVVIFPQCGFGQEWYGDMESQVMAALESSIREFHGDRRRVYLTGISMGGTGAWYMARHRRRFAAVVPICGEVARDPADPFPVELPPDIARIVGAPDPYSALAQAIGTTPVWAFHGTRDDEVPVRESRNMVEALRRGGGTVTYTEYPGIGHDAWDLAYADAGMARWLLQQRMRPLR
ncbi:MAG TPA: PHB depolymerase family esterase [Thermoanaerobaculia bacterium]|nr:PHB depolymerase family esterase [Thermoanaerobaculia bacterium]